MASGLEGQRFRFAGYLPAEAAARARARSPSSSGVRRADDETQVFIETPYRNDALLADVLAGLPRRRRGLRSPPTSPAPGEWIRDGHGRGVARAPRRRSASGPAIFLLLA